MRSYHYLPILLACATACTSDPSDAESTEDPYEVKPFGTGDLARVTLHVASGFSEDVPALGAHFRFTLNNTPLKLEESVAIPSTGDKWLTFHASLVTRSGQTLAMLEEGIAPLAPHEARSINLSVVKLWWTNYPQAWASLVVPSARGNASFAREWEGHRWGQWFRPGDGQRGYALNSANGIPLPVLAGHYSYRLDNSSLPPISFDVGEGVTLDRSAAYDDFIGREVLAFEDRGGYADGKQANVVVNCEGAERTFARSADGKDIEISILLGKKESATQCTYEVNGFVDTFAITPTSVEPNMGKIALKRLNVADVVLTDEGGATVRGSYRIRRYDDAKGLWGDWKVQGATSTGVDVPPGKYQIWVRYSAHGKAAEQWFYAEL